MKVAVIGAGPAGLACTHELERHGISPVVFELKHRPGELFEHTAAVFEIFARPYDPLVRLREKFKLELRPLSILKSVDMKSPGYKVTITGNLGYFLLRGHNPLSVETQMMNKLKSEIVTNTKVDYKQLCLEFDYVVVANGSYDISRTEGVWSLVYPTKFIGGTVVGSFNTEKMFMWLDTRYSKTAYAYLTPMDKKSAFLGLVVPHSNVEEAKRRWKTFWQLEHHPYDLVSEVVMEHNAGFVYPHQVKNLLFAGIAGGFQEPFLGFGLISSIKSGILAGRAIATGQRYEDLLYQLKEDMQHSLLLRDFFNNIGNDGYDIVLKCLGAPGLKQIIYNTNIDVVRLGSATAAGIKKIIGNIRGN